MRLRARMRMLESPGWTYKTIVPTITKNALRGDSGTAKKVGADGHIVQPSGKRKTACTATVVDFFGVNPVRFNKCSGVPDAERILRNHNMSVKDAGSRLGLKPMMRVDRHSPTGWTALVKVPQVKAAIKKYSRSKKGVLAYYMVRVCNKQGGDGHLIVLDANAANRVDTDPRLRDARYASHVLMVRPNAKLQAKIDADREAERRDAEDWYERNREYVDAPRNAAPPPAPSTGGGAKPHWQREVDRARTT